MNVLFIFSLPRSGSTLLQRVLASHEKISTVAEPWVLLPFVYPLKREGVYTEYSHAEAYDALQDFCAELPQGESDYLGAVRKAVLDLYQQVSDEHAEYFLDKTPRYHLIVDEIIRMFPDGRFIFLWRNPLSVIASIMETWGAGKWIIPRFKIDLFDGLQNLIKVCEERREHLFTLNYEDVVSGNKEIWEKLFEYLGLDFSPLALEEFAGVELRGRMGDSTGVKDYNSLNNEPVEKWKSILTNPFRKAWCRKYLKWIGRERLAVMGYDLDQMIEDINAIPFSMHRLFSDLVYATFWEMCNWFEPFILRDKLKRLPHAWRVHAHR